ncbi:MAG TPA: class I SAM-dependent methyltransferase [Iamia sp.]
MDIATDRPAPNHHADHPGFSGISGELFAALFALAGRRKARTVAQIAGVRPGDHLVDVGCGSGPAVRAALRRGATADGVDPSSTMLAVARRLTRPGRPARWRVGTAESIPVADGAATVVWSVATVHHWQDVVAGLAEAHRVLRPGGRLLAVERRIAPDADGLASHGWTEAQAESFATASRAAGFSDVEVQTHPLGKTTQLVVRAQRP